MGTLKVGAAVVIGVDGANGAPVKAGQSGTVVARIDGIDHLVIKMNHQVDRPFSVARRHGGDYLLTPDNLRVP